MIRKSKFDACECSLKSFCRIFGQYPQCTDEIPSLKEQEKAKAAQHQTGAP